VEKVTIDGVDIHLAGISALRGGFDLVTGSGAALTSSPLERAYFELIERASILMVGREGGSDGVMREADGKVRGLAGAEVLLPASPTPSIWRFARSNGVAVGESWGAACRRALWELIERDRLLRSWYGHLRPTPMPLPTDVMPSGLSASYDLEAYRFDESADSSVAVVGIFGFPKYESAPMLYGFGARAMPSEALAAARNECLQRLGFLWGEEIPPGPPEFSPTPDYHLEVFLPHAAQWRIASWLRGDHLGMCGSPVTRAVSAGTTRLFADITPVALAGRLSVAMAIPEGELPLTFGIGHPSIAEVPEALKVHPIA
jgi:hypothetical protein